MAYKKSEGGFAQIYQTQNITSSASIVIYRDGKSVSKTGTGFQETHTVTLTQEQLRTNELTVLRVSVTAAASRSGSDGQIRCLHNSVVQLPTTYTIANGAENDFAWAFDIKNPAADNTISIEVSPAGGTDVVINFEIRATIIA